MMEYISQGTSQNTYKEFPVTVEPFARVEIFYDFDYFRVLDLDAPADALSIAFGGNSQETSFKGVGIGYKLNQAVNKVTIINKSNQTIKILVALGMGLITDDRVNFGGGGGVPTDPIIPTSFGTGQFPVNNVASIINSANSQKAYVSIQAGSQDLFIGNDNTVTPSTGFKISAGSTYSFETTADIFGVVASGTDTVFTLTGNK